MSDKHFTREPVNVPDLLERDNLVRRFRQMRERAAAYKAEYERWNRAHPGEEIATDFWDSVIAWCDGTGPLPKEIADRMPPSGHP